MHVGTPNSEVEAEIRSRCTRARNEGAEIDAEVEDQWVQQALEIHAENRRIYQAVTSGRF